ncbi:HupE/UreJ family protein [Litorimonas sp. RW-G-Af-16]|uniref:HupE/UreJ family protein n=1 Tax=Litorimonas sp. RW-G-Af-16 TaxID=3241168 RepID=UPI00390C97DD
MKLFAFIFSALIYLIALPASAHEVRPAFLNVTETAPSTFDVIWKQPVIDGKRLRITPEFPHDCTDGARSTSRARATIIERWEIICDLNSGDIRLNGLERTLTDAFIEIRYATGDSRSALLKPADPVMRLDRAPSSPAREYLRIGVDHIIYGWDHLLFVLGLVLLVNRRQVWGVATAFTLAHSITLALAAFGLLSVPTRPVEILIAMSIVLLAVEIIAKLRGTPMLGARRPYLISFLIGLIHGCGFASALSEIGLPKGTELFALLLFNIGVELGQFAIIALGVAIFWALGKWAAKAKRPVEILTTYTIATIAMYWVIERLAGYVV